MKELLDYIDASRKAGTSDSEIVASLKSAGWDDAAISQAMQYDPPHPTDPPTSIMTPGTAALPATVIEKPTIKQAARRAWDKIKYKKYIGSVIILVILALAGLKAYSYYISDPDKVWADTTNKMTQIESANFKFDLSYSEPAPENPEDSDMGFFGTGDLKFSVSGNGVMAINKEHKDANYDMASELETKMGGLTISLDFLSRKVGDYIYYKLDGFPLGIGGLFGSGSDKSDWLKININESENKEWLELEKSKDYALDAIKKARLIKPTKLVGSETIDGVATWHYEAQLDKQEIKNYFATLKNIFKDENFNELNAVIDRVEFRKLALWIGKSDHLIHQVIIESNSPSLFTASLDSAREKSRDARRLADVRQTMTALELFFNDNGRYPTATNGQPTPTDGSPSYSSYLFTQAESPTPADGHCSETDNKYKYQRLALDSYELTFCLGYDAGGYKAGLIKATQAGLQNVTESGAGANPESAIQNIPFTGTIYLKLNLSNFNKKVEIKEPEGKIQNHGAADRDATRMSDTRKIMTALELFFYDNGRYPTAANGKPTPTDGGQSATFNIYLGQFPEAPTPADGDCSTENNKYYYAQVNGGQDYSLTFCIGSDDRYGYPTSYKAGNMEATSSGLKEKR